MMGVVWENSSDVICISVKGMAGDVTTILSPTYLKLFSKRENILEDKVEKKEGFGPKVIAFDLPSDYFEGIQNTTDNQLKRRKYTPSLVYDVDFAKDQKKTSSSPKCNKEDLQSIAQLVSTFSFGNFFFIFISQFMILSTGCEILESKGGRSCYACA